MASIAEATWSGNLAEFKTYLKSLKNEDQVAAVYIFTNVKNNRQYVGSTRNIHIRLKNYTENARLARSSQRGSLICRSIARHGLSSFYAEIYLPSLDVNQSTKHWETLILMNEQMFLDRYDFSYNIQRSVNPGPVNAVNRNITIYIYIWNLSLWVSFRVW